MAREATAPPRRRGRLRRFRSALGRHPLWTAVGIVLVLLLAARIAVPFAVEGLIERQSRDYLVGRLEVGDVDLSLVRGLLTLQDVTAYGPARNGDPDADRWFHAASISFNIAWRPLFDHVVRVQELVLDEPFVAVTRAANGALDLQTRLRASGEQPAQPPEQSQPWRVMVDDGAIHGGRLRYRDVSIGGAERLRMEIAQLEAHRLTFDPGASERPGSVRMTGSVAGAPFEVAMTVAPRPGGEFDVAGTVHAHALPLARGRVYVPTLRRFASLEGALDADLRIVRDAGTRQTLSGHVALRDLALRTPRLEQPAFTCDSVTVVADTIDLNAQKAEIRRVALLRPTLVVRTEPAVSVPVVTTATGAPPPPAAAGKPAGRTVPAPPPSGTPPRPGEEAATGTPLAKQEGPPPGRPAPPHAKPPAAAPAPQAHPAPADDGAATWSWSVGELALRDGRTILLHGGATDTLEVEARAQDLSPTGTFPLDATVRLPPGRVRFEGNVALAPSRLEGDLEIDDLPLPAVAAAAGSPIGGLDAGTLAADLRVSLGAEGADGAAPQLEASGHLAVTGWKLAAADPDAFAVAWDALEMDVERASVPLEETAGPEQVHLTQLVMRNPHASLRRTESGGFVLPGAAEGAAAEGAAPGTGATATGSPPSGAGRAAAGPQPAEPGAEGQPATAAAAAPAPAQPQVTIDAFRLENGLVKLEDRAVQPFYRNTLRDIDVEIQALRYPGFHMDRLEATLSGLGTKPVRITGHAEDDGFVLDAEGTKIRLAPLNPYVTSYSDYALEGGTLTFGADADLQLRRSAYDAKLSLRIHDLGLDAPKAFRRDFGISLALGLALLRDVHGDIVLTVPIRGGEQGTQVGILGTVRSAFHRAVLNALATPLKLVGAIVRRHGEIAAYEPQPIPFHTASAALTERARSALADLAQALARKPALAVELRPVVLQAEETALEKAPPPQPAQGESKYPATPDALAAARLDAVRSELVENLGVPSERVATVADPLVAKLGPPRVEVSLAPAPARG